MPRLKKVTEWNRPECGRVVDEVNKALAEAGRKLGINIQKAGGGTFNNSSFTFKVECALIGTDGVVKDKEAEAKEAEAFKDFASHYGLKPDDFGKTFTAWSGKTYTICGLNTRARKHPIQAKNIKDETYRFSAEEVKALLERA